MRVGNLVIYDAGGEKYGRVAIVTYVNDEGGTVKAVDLDGETQWFVTSYCRTLSPVDKKTP